MEIKTLKLKYSLLFISVHYFCIPVATIVTCNIQKYNTEICAGI